MTNKIDHIANAGLGQRGRVTADGAGTGAASGRGAPAAGTDSARISGQAAGLAAVDRALSATADVDVARVAELRDALDAGRYQVDAGAVADKMVQIEQLLGTGR